MRTSDIPALSRALARAHGAASGVFRDRDHGFEAAALIAGSSLGGQVRALAGRCVLIATHGQIEAALAMIELDGVASRIVIAPPDVKQSDLQAIMADAGVEAIIADEPGDFASTGLPRFVCRLPIVPASEKPRTGLETEWVLLTSGTTGRPKMVVHRLSGLTGAIGDTPTLGAAPVWATFYDIRRYGGLQIFLRAVFGGGSLILSSHGEPISAHLQRLGANGVTHISGTPSHWRRVLMSQHMNVMAPAYIRLSGEIADQAVLDALREAYPQAAIGHAYASTEAGVGFDVNDGLEGFPVAFAERHGGPVEMKVVDGSLRIRSQRTATRYAGPASAGLADADGFVDTGDMLEQRGDRYYFAGRRNGIVNVGGLKVHPEEVEAAINGHPKVLMSLVSARKNPFTGSIVVADVVLDPEAAAALENGETGGVTLKTEILEVCRSALDRHKVPVSIRFVPALDMTPGGKLRRVHA
ncbi:MAG: AMP-binding protein [Beijerinckiaceae bacterium]|nr:AMP-binding protein [Beijerinckiaceae bacterium]